MEEREPIVNDISIVEIPPNITISDAVGKLKSYSSRHLRSKFKFIREIYLEKDGIWSAGYFSSTIGLNEEQIKRYIDWQGKQELPQTLNLFAQPKLRAGSSFTAKGNPGRRR